MLLFLLKFLTLNFSSIQLSRIPLHLTWWQLQMIISVSLFQFLSTPTTLYLKTFSWIIEFQSFLTFLRIIFLVVIHIQIHILLFILIHLTPSAHWSCSYSHRFFHFQTQILISIWVFSILCLLLRNLTTYINLRVIIVTSFRLNRFLSTFRLLFIFLNNLVETLIKSLRFRSQFQLLLITLN